ncbi:branched-chain-amino-acid transaminase [Neisseria sp. ZJ106]|uniref:branched-chain-amino-acid transaminase n=1 Tax=Neisseria lisongii TaxID=2912188 RepID=A0AAW5AI85_9NEIS|nr:branched-chain-amino-acid transaminase [Neisseria lisongii]MCF7521173.1 branched-chain-amino-acid transaminase [Neisseria lisongii]MCF7529812.1 branched-chain-amino-acid transaminase [Neisseria lisongii]WCL71667.1 branched-chain-amino-acid transaminase [Neisseria lisongii]
MSRPVPAVFGSVFHAQMPVIAFQDGAWQPVRWQSSQDLTLPAGAHALHYGSECFEGLKAFRQANGKIVMFRPTENIKRMQQSAEILSLPKPETEPFLAALVELVKRAADEIPDAPASLYLRPTLIGTDPVIGKAGAPSETALLYILASPVGDYFKAGSPVKILVETEHIRCAPHMGRVKCGGNYASAMPWILKAKAEHGASQVLFCPNGDVQETGASNFMVINGDEIVTKPLTDEFLHGVTRQSVLTVAADLGYRISERNFTVDELKAMVENGAEAILTGTAAVISPITSFVIDGKEIEVKSQERGYAIRKAVTDIQFGLAEDKYGWLVEVC